MRIERREFLQSVAAGVALTPMLAWGASRSQQRGDEIIDTHQHLWDLSRQKLLWLAGAPDVLRHDFGPNEYNAATEDLNIKAIYMEVDVDPSQHDMEAEHVIELCRSGKHATVAAVIGGRPDADDFGEYIIRHGESGVVKGVRQVLHGESTPAGHCLRDAFVRGVRLLGKQGMSFDLCMRPAELPDAARLIDQCPDTRFVLDHCGNADVKVFMKRASDEQPSHDPDAWKRDIDAIAKRQNVICKISGIIASAPRGEWTADDLAPIVNHCLDSFGPDRVVFGGDWPVCLLGGELRAWVNALRAIVAPRPREQQVKLWSTNARRFYGLS